MRNLLLLALTTVIIASGCNFGADTEENGKEQTSNKKVERFIAKEVEVFDLSDDHPEINFKKSGLLSADKDLSVFPELSGKITEVYVKVGENVEKGDLIARIGDSLNTDNIDLQAETAQRSLDLSRDSLNTAQELGNSNLESANLAAELAFNSYQNSIEGRENTINTLNEQRNSLEISVEAAEDALDNAEDSRKDARKALNDAEDDYEDYIDNADPIDPATRDGLQAAIDGAEAALDGAKAAEDGAEIGLEQAESALEQFDKSYQGQLDNLDFAIESSYQQYLSALQQANSSAIGTEQQLISIQSQIAQAESAQRQAELSQSKKEIRATIDGVITEINVDEGDNVSPQQSIASLQDLDESIVVTSVNDIERELIAVGNLATIESNDEEVRGEIVSISPSLNAITKKIEVEIRITGSHSLVPGSPVNVFFSPAKTNAIFVPINSVYIDDDSKIVKTVNSNNKVKYLEIETGTVVGNYIEVIAGLQGDEQVISDQTKFLEEGDLVEITSVND